MPKFEVRFTIEQPTIGDATNRALVALYKGGLDAESVSVQPVSGGEAWTHSKPEYSRTPKKFRIREPHKDEFPDIEE